MKFKSEKIDEVTNEVILEFEASREEKEALDKFCEEKGMTLDEMVNTFLRDSLSRPEELFKWVKETRTDKLPKGTPGKPFYKKGDKTGFYLTYKEKEYFCIGTIEIIDAYGTYFQKDNEPSYDIMVENFADTGAPMFCKHITESSCYNI